MHGYEPFVAWQASVTFGDNVVDCYEDRGLMFPGGNALNVSVFANRFGAFAASYAQTNLSVQLATIRQGIMSAPRWSAKASTFHDCAFWRAAQPFA